MSWGESWGSAWGSAWGYLFQPVTEEVARFTVAAEHRTFIVLPESGVVSVNAETRGFAVDAENRVIEV